MNTLEDALAPVRPHEPLHVVTLRHRLWTDGVADVEQVSQSSLIFRSVVFRRRKSRL
jgi:hypothetical protein